MGEKMQKTKTKQHSYGCMTGFCSFFDLQEGGFGFGFD